MIRLPPISNRPATPFPYPTLFRSLAGDWENDIADAPGWIVDRSAGNLDQESLLAIDPLDVFRDIAHHLAFRARSDLMDRLDQQVDHRIRKLSFPRHQINGIEP